MSETENKEKLPICVASMVKEWLTQHGYDGLCSETYECGCGVDDLAPCGEGITDCVGARRVVAQVDDEVDGVRVGDAYFQPILE